MKKQIPVEVSARHVHLSKKDLETLFGKGHKLKNIKQLTQPSDFCAEEVVDIKVGDKVIKNARVVGPEREKTQVEISITDAFFLGVNPPLRISGDLEESGSVIILGPVREVNLNEGLIIAKRHIHCSSNEAEKLGLKNGDKVSVKIEEERPLAFYDVIVRIRNDYKLCLHLDTDEGNAAGINKKGIGEIL